MELVEREAVIYHMYMTISKIGSQLLLAFTTANVLSGVGIQ